MVATPTPSHPICGETADAGRTRSTITKKSTGLRLRSSIPVPNQSTAKSIFCSYEGSTTKILKQGSPERRAHDRTQSTQEQGNHSIEKKKSSARLEQWFALARFTRGKKESTGEAVRALGLLFLSKSKDEAAASSSRPKK